MSGFPSFFSCSSFTLLFRRAQFPLSRFRSRAGGFPLSAMENHSRSRASSGFSLVEVVLALGICSFAMIAIVGMIPVGLTTFKDAMNTTVQSQIVQGIASDILLADYVNLAADEICYNDQGTRTSATSGDLAYTAKVLAPEVLTLCGGEKVVIRIAKTHPGQTFEQVEAKFPNQISSYPVIVAKVGAAD